MTNPLADPATSGHILAGVTLWTSFRNLILENAEFIMIIVPAITGFAATCFYTVSIVMRVLEYLHRVKRDKSVNTKAEVVDD